MESGELQDSEKITVADSLKFITPNGKIVYGGGGIIPDVFVPIDNGIQNETFNYRHANDKFSKQEFIDSFEMGDDMVFAFQDYVNMKTASNITFVAYHKEIKLYLKATLADQLYGDGAYEEILNKDDAMVDEVIKLSEHTH